MTKTVTTYQCDICGAEFTEKEKLKVAHVPGRGCDSEGYPMGYEDLSWISVMSAGRNCLKR